MQKRAIIAMSGGVDSSVAAYLMVKDGYDCAGATLKLYETHSAVIPDIVPAVHLLILKMRKALLQDLESFIMCFPCMTSLRKMLLTNSLTPIFMEEHLIHVSTVTVF